MRLTRRYRFAASHRLYSPKLSEEENRELYGKCANPHGHGHNYVLEVSVRGPVDSATGMMVDTAKLDALVREQVVNPFDHANLNTQFAVFTETVPTTENVSVEIRNRLASEWEGAFPGRKPRLEKIRLYETRKNIFELTGES